MLRRVGGWLEQPVGDAARTCSARADGKNGRAAALSQHSLAFVCGQGLKRDLNRAFGVHCLFFP